ncbi:hypothetical protein WMY93_023542 [Mugilogobius chulae]|uniref:Interferon regulatory factor-3 domain-containing protein n=1 Tax=Mugilogobius chulae TaxID=88201 RepID=A0AAW0NGX6_9GOBI
MIQDNSKNSDDPHKIFEIISTEGLAMQNSQEDSDLTPDIYSSPTEYFPPVSEINILNTFKALDISNNMPEQGWENNYMIPQSSPVVPSYPGVSASTNDVVIIPQSNSYFQPIPAQFNPPQPPPINNLEISIFYRKKEMLKTTVSCQFLQLHYPQETRGHDIQDAICFPSTDGLKDHKQIEFTNRILNSIQRGLLLQVDDTGIYGYRQDRCHVFTSTSDSDVAHPNPQKLPLDTKVQLLSFENYVQELRNFCENNSRSPEYTIKMCFGEKFPDGKALEKKLIVVKVVPLVCRYLHEQAQENGASSLHSSNISLQTSYNSLMDFINAYIGPPTVED